MSSSRGACLIMDGRQRRRAARIVVATVALIALELLGMARPGWGDRWGVSRAVAYLVPYLIVGWDVLRRAARGVVRGSALGEDFLMSAATIGALALAVWEDGSYVEAVAVMLLFQLGELFQSVAVGRSRRDIGALMDIRPDHADVERGGEIVRMSPSEVLPESVIVVRPGERIPLDGVALEGRASLDRSALTGESAPRAVAPGDDVPSGCIVLDGVLRIKTTRPYGESTVARILALVEGASARKSRAERLVSRFARVYTPTVCVAVLALAVVPPVARTLFLGLSPAWGEHLYRALTFLTISCPCALVISVPLTAFAGLGRASREGILVKGSNYLEALGEARTVVFDKTGTLTRGTFDVVAVCPSLMDEKELLHIAAHVERWSTHPIAAALRRAWPDEMDGCRVEEAEELVGMGVRAMVDGRSVCVGNAALMEQTGAAWTEHHGPGTVVHVSVDGQYAGHVVVRDAPKEGAREAVDALRACGVERVVMLTGDSRATATKVADELGIREVCAELLPDGKVAKLEELLAEGRGRVAFVGDGINDAPVLARADVGIAMGALGTDAAIEAADIVLMDDDPMKIAKAMRISRRSMRIVRQNVAGSIVVKAACLALGAVGMASMWLAVFADVGVMILAVANAGRAWSATDI